MWENGFGNKSEGTLNGSQWLLPAFNTAQPYFWRFKRAKIFLTFKVSKEYNFVNFDSLTGSHYCHIHSIRILPFPAMISLLVFISLVQDETYFGNLVEGKSKNLCEFTRVTNTSKVLFKIKYFNGIVFLQKRQ